MLQERAACTTCSCNDVSPNDAADGGDKKDYDDVNHKYRDDAPTDALHSSSFMQMHIKLSPLQAVMVMAVVRFDALMLKRLCAKKSIITIIIIIIIITTIRDGWPHQNG